MWEAMGPVAKMWSMAVDRREPWRMVKLVGVAGGTRQCLAESGPRAPSAEARGVPGARVEVAQEDAQVGTYAGAEAVHYLDLRNSIGVQEACGEVGVEQEGTAP